MPKGENMENNHKNKTIEGYIMAIQELLTDNEQVTIWKDNYEVNPKVMESEFNLTKSESLNNLKDGVYRMNFFRVGDPS